MSAFCPCRGILQRFGGASQGQLLARSFTGRDRSLTRARSEAPCRLRAGQFRSAPHGRPEAILRDPSVDAVILLTPPTAHLDFVRRCAASSKHVLLEKPVE